MKLFRSFINESKSFVAYHNTDAKSFDSIMQSGFKLNTRVKRKKLFGQGIYFSEKPNTRWGDHTVKVNIFPKKPLIDREGDIAYEGNELGDKVQEIGNKLYSNFKMSNSKMLADAIEKFLKQEGYDLLVSDEMGKTIYVVRDPSIIRII